MLFRNTNVNQSISSSILEKDFKTIQYFKYFIHNNCYCKLDKKAMTQKEFDWRQPTGWAYISERSRNSKELKKFSPLCFSFFWGGHTSSTILNSCSFQRYRPLSVKASSNFLTHPLSSNLNHSLMKSNHFLYPIQYIILNPK